MNDNLLIIVILFFFTAIFFTWFFIHKAKTKERLLLIEKGVELSSIPKRRRFKFPWLKIGIVITCGSIGVLLGGFLEYFNLFKPEENTSIMGRSILHSRGMISLLFMYIFGGVGMILAHYLSKKKDR